VLQSQLSWNQSAALRVPRHSRDCCWQFRLALRARPTLQARNPIQEERRQNQLVSYPTPVAWYEPSRHGGRGI
jgi:hypothetical protein